MSVEDCTKGWYTRCAGAKSPINGCSCNCDGKNHGTLQPGARDTVSMPLTSVKIFSVHKPKVFLPGFLVRPDIHLRRDTEGHPDTNVIRRYAYHSSEGFDWGRLDCAQMGRLDLSLNILGMFIPSFWAWQLHYRYDKHTIAGIIYDGAIISSARTVLWIAEQYGKDAMIDLPLEV